MVLRSAGGGGYGDPLQRDPALVATDVREGFVSPQAARALYGVVLDDRGAPDAVQTTAQRAALLAARHWLRVMPCADAFRAGAVSRRRICRLHPADAAHFNLAEDSIVELDSGKAAPLRAWVVLDADVAVGTVPLDPRGQAILACSPGAMLEVRALFYGTPAAA